MPVETTGEGMTLNLACFHTLEKKDGSVNPFIIFYFRTYLSDRHQRHTTMAVSTTRMLVVTALLLLLTETSSASHAPSQHEQHQQRQLNPSIGTFNFLVILVQFTDHQDRNLPPVEYYQELCDGTGPSAINPAGSIAEYFEKQSYGKFNVKCDVRDWRLTNNTEEYFAKGQRGIIGTLEGQEFFKPVLDEIEAESDQFFFFDLDGAGGGGDDNGAIELIVLHSGYAAESSQTDCAGRDRSDRIWSQAHIGVDGGWATSDKNFKVQGYTVASGLDYKDECLGGIGAKVSSTMACPDKNSRHMVYSCWIILRSVYVHLRRRAPVTVQDVLPTDVVISRRFLLLFDRWGSLLTKCSIRFERMTFTTQTFKTLSVASVALTLWRLHSVRAMIWRYRDRLAPIPKSEPVG